ncbi:uncharacterized protein I206_104343 [Kwoniella pini CBS 10737]|uniref:Uncharacterized protein n=1 Tax=Kwoniella pini CBS 10737 TaxID=1296096 RepID=A0A1B9I212_9TREE|nr:uncharacterized protein I206_04079 [Kwoniella pini CBS 10737]OCF49557.1 hypothetical protein I206_04079 [Kwoniella pini CBS 10737]
MAELTPPSSHNSTPVRASNEELPPSPTAGFGSTKPHPLMKSHPMDLDQNLSESSSSDEEEDDNIILKDQGQDEEGSEVGDESLDSDQEQEQGQSQSQDDEDKADQGKEKFIESSQGTKGKGKTRNKRSKRQQQQVKSSSLTTSKSKGNAGRKDGDLWESDIVDRWNIEIGDVCADNANPVLSSYSTSVTA